jgi:hypothetical protein
MPSKLLSESAPQKEKSPNGLDFEMFLKNRDFFEKKREKSSLMKSTAGMKNDIIAMVWQTEKYLPCVLQ